MGQAFPSATPMTRESVHNESADPRFARGPEAWLIGAFLVFFSVAVAAAMPAIAAAARTAAADAGAGASNEALKVRVVLRVEARSVRFALPQLGGDVGIAPTSAASYPVSIVQTAVTLHGQDARLRQRGFNARAPPADFA